MTVGPKKVQNRKRTILWQSYNTVTLILSEILRKQDA